MKSILLSMTLLAGLTLLSGCTKPSLEAPSAIEPNAPPLEAIVARTDQLLALLNNAYLFTSDAKLLLEKEAELKELRFNPKSPPNYNEEGGATSNNSYSSLCRLVISPNRRS